jgi:hypothetical protein
MATNQEVQESLGTNPQGFSNELFLDVCESFRYDVMSYPSGAALLFPHLFLRLGFGVESTNAFVFPDHVRIW